MRLLDSKRMYYLMFKVKMLIVLKNLVKCFLTRLSTEIVDKWRKKMHKCKDKDSVKKSDLKKLKKDILKEDKKIDDKRYQKKTGKNK